jgi:hypothetical protein
VLLEIGYEHGSDDDYSAFRCLSLGLYMGYLYFERYSGLPIRGKVERLGEDGSERW